MPVCVRFMPVDFPPPWPPMTAMAPAGPAAFRKSPNSAKRFVSSFAGLPLVVTSTTFPLSRETCLISLSMSNMLTVTTSPSAPLAGVEPVQPMASTCSSWRTGARISPSALPRVQPRQMVYFSVCTFSRPMDFIFAAPHSSALRSAGVPVTRPPMSSLSSVRKPKACEFIIPSPAIRVRAGFVPSSSGPLGAVRLSALSGAPAALRQAATTANFTKTRCISSLLAPLALNKTTMHSDAAIAGLYATSVAGLVVLATDIYEHLYRALTAFYTASEPAMKHTCNIPAFLLYALTLCFLSSSAPLKSSAQEVQQKPEAKASAQAAEKKRNQR